MWDLKTSDPDVFGDVFIGAEQMAKLTGVSRDQLYYWGKAGYILKKNSGKNQFPLSQLPKARIMNLLVNEIGLDPKMASTLADAILKADQKPTEAEVEAVLKLLKAISKIFVAIVEAFKKRGETERLREIIDFLKSSTEVVHD